MDGNAVDICVIEDDSTERALLLRRFVRQGLSIVQASDGVSGLELVRRHRPRVVVCDVMLPDLSGIELCQQVRTDSTLAGTYLIMITAYDSQKRKRDALNAGADEYLIKPYDPDELEAKTRNGLRLSRLQEKLRRAALTDGLTGVWNHAHFRDLLDKEFSRTRRYGGEVALLMIDLDHFKAVNDTYGHEAGNHVLRATAQHLQRSVRDIDIVARFGGEEFTVICPQTSLADAAQIAERIRAALPTQVRLPGHPELEVHASFGVASSTDARAVSAQDLAECADQCLYEAKARGRDRVCRCDQVGDANMVAPLPSGEVERLRKQVVELSMKGKQLCLQSVWALVQALEARDPYTARHSRSVCFYTERLVGVAGWPEHLRTATTNAAMLHDLGKIGVPDRILQKPDALNAAEAAVIRQVPLQTCRILEPLKVFETETTIVRHLRERFDGSGYPDGLQGPNIPIGSRLLAVTETLDALTSDRAYRASCSLEQALAAIAADAGTHFDPAFTELVAKVAAVEAEVWRAHIAQNRDDAARASVALEHL